MSVLPNFSTCSSELFEFGGAIAAGFVARVLVLNSISPVAAALGAPAVIVADHIAQMILSKILQAPCVQHCCPTLSRLHDRYGFMMAKPLTFAFTLLLTLGIAALAGATYAIGTALVVAVILTTGLFMAQVGFRIAREMIVPCLRCCEGRQNTQQPPNLLQKNVIVS